MLHRIRSWFHPRPSRLEQLANQNGSSLERLRAVAASTLRDYNVKRTINFVYKGNEYIIRYVGPGAVDLYLFNGDYHPIYSPVRGRVPVEQEEQILRFLLSEGNI